MLDMAPILLTLTGLLVPAGSNLLSFTTDASANGTGSLVTIQTGTGATFDPLRVRAGSTEGLMVDDGGNVGIGTTSPQSKLHIIGT